LSKIEVDKVDPQSGTTLTLGTSGDTVSIPSGVTLVNNGTASGFGDNLEWQSSIVTASTITVVANRGYWIDTTSNACTITLPGAASVGDRLIFTDYARNWATNNVTINQNSLKFQGNTTPNPVYDTNGQSVDIVYSGATKGWIPNSDDDVIFETPQTYTADFLVLAGGGSGAEDIAGGGGAGGLRSSVSSTGGGGSNETALQLTPGTVYTATVGAGYPAGNNDAGSGSPSSIAGSGITTITSVGGGEAGGHDGYGATSDNGQPGGCGGGARGSGTGGSGTSNQGFAGGNGNGTGGGGGGGTSAVGVAGASNNGGNGGAGTSNSITGSAVTYGGGGGGGVTNGNSVGSGGSGGGGAGSNTQHAKGVDGSVNLGGGGGGGGNSTNTDIAAGGSGIVILRILTSDYTETVSGSPTVTTDGSHKVIKFTGTGTYTA